MATKKHPTSKKPQGTITRGKTAKNRLRQVDHFIMIYDPMLISANGNELFVDLGYGFEATTTIELASRFHAINPLLKVLGVEIDPERVEKALPFKDQFTDFRLGGFNVPIKSGEKIRGIRAFNVLRQYEESDVIAAWDEMGRNVIEGGILVEGTSNPNGSIWVANILRMKNGSWAEEGIVFYTNFYKGFQLTDFQAVLPKNYIHRMIEGEMIFDLFEKWRTALYETSAQRSWGDKAWFVSAAKLLCQNGIKINTHKKFLDKGFFVFSLQTNSPIS